MRVRDSVPRNPATGAPFEQTPYGRETELRQLCEAIDRLVTGESGLVLVRGPAGSGKTTLVTSGLRHCLADRNEDETVLSHVRVATGTFEEDRQNEPYTALRQALGSLVRQVLAAEDRSVAWWRKHVRSSLGSTGQAVVDLIPELAWLAGTQPALPELEPEAHQQRFYFTVQRSVTALAPPGKPLILVLENLQWADPGSLHLIAALAEASESRALLILATIRSGQERDDGLSDQPPLLAGPAASAASLATIELRPLSEESVVTWLAAQLAALPDQIRGLAERLHLHAQGNPLFLTELLAALRCGGDLFLDGESGCWRWDAAALDRLALDDDLAGLLALSVNRLPAQVREFLATAALLGEEFTVETLGRVQSVGGRAVATILQPALAAGLVMLAGEATAGGTETYRFRHDRIRTAALALLDKGKREKLHLCIGEALLGIGPVWPSSIDSSFGDHATEQTTVFRATYHLNAAAALINDPVRRRALAQLNLQAARLARATAAYEAAWDYLCQARSWLPADEAAWQDDAGRNGAPLAFAIRLAAAEAGYLTGRHEAVASLAAETLEHLSSPVEKARIYLPWIQSAIARYELDSAGALAVEALRPLGIQLRVQESTLNLLRLMAQVRWALRGRSVDRLFELPRVTDPRLQEAARILGVIANSAYWRGSPRRTALLALQSLQITLRFGLFPTSPLGFAGYAAVLCMLRGDVRCAHSFGELAQRLTEDPDGRAHRARVAAPVYYVVNHRTRPLRESLGPLRAGYQVGLETGDVESALLCALCYAIHAFQIGEPLATLERHLRETTLLAAQLGHRSVELPSAANHQAVLNLMGRSMETVHLTGDACDEGALEDELVRSDNRSALTALRVRRAHLAFLFGDSATALALAEAVRPRSTEIAGSYAYPSFLTLDAVIRLDRWDGASAAERRRFEREAAEDLRKLKPWVKTAPQNHLQHLHLMAAELARVQGRPAEAAAEFEAALAQCEENGWIADGAMVAERAARFCFARGQIERGREHVKRALAYCEQWGALALVRHIEHKYGLWLDAGTAGSGGESLQTTEVLEPSSPPKSVSLDWNGLQAKAAAWQDADLSELLQRTMWAIVGAAAAERGVLLVADALDDAPDSVAALEIASICDQTGACSIPAKVKPFVDAGDEISLPRRIVNFVVHSHQPLVLGDARTEPPFDRDPQVVANHIRSVLCLPLLQAGRLCGLLYLEDTRDPDHFASVPPAALTVLTLQAALAVQNERLVAGLRAQSQPRLDSREISSEPPAPSEATTVPLGAAQRVMELIRLARRHVEHGQYEPATARVADALALAHHSEDSGAWRQLALGFTPDLAVLPGGLQHVPVILARVTALGQAADPATQWGLLVQRITTAWLHGRLDDVLTGYREAIADAFAGDGGALPAALLDLAISALTARRQYDEAQQHLERLGVQLRRDRPDNLSNLGRLFRNVRLDWLRGAVPASGSLPRAQRRLTELAPHPMSAVLLPTLDGITEEVAGRHEAAVACFREAAAAAGDGSASALLVDPTLLLANALHAHGATDEALDLLSGVLARRVSERTPGLVVQEGAVLIPLLRLSAQQGRSGPAAAHVLSLLGVSNVTRRLLIPDTRILLSPREVDVLELLAVNASNRAIAERLGVDMLTVKSHVTRVLAKLAVQTRHQAAERGRALGLGQD